MESTAFAEDKVINLQIVPIEIYIKNQYPTTSMDSIVAQAAIVGFGGAVCGAGGYQVGVDLEDCMHLPHGFIAYPCSIGCMGLGINGGIKTCSGQSGEYLFGKK